MVLGLNSGEGAGGVARYTAAGRPDLSFGDDGIAGLNLKAGPVYPRDVVVDARGRTVVAGEGFRRGNPRYGATLVRLRPNGRPDPSFSGDGFNFPKALEGMTPFEITFARKGRIIMVGQVAGTPSSKVFVARFLPDGNLDPAFSGDGYRFVDIGARQFAPSFAIDPKNRIVIAAGSKGPGKATWQLIRLRPGGSLDSSFSDDGRLEPAPAKLRGGLADATVDRQGRILAACSNSHGFVVRFKPGGRIDSSFGNGGSKALAWFDPSSISVDLKGRPVIAGASDEIGANVFRLSPDGDGVVRISVDALTWLDDHFIDSKNRIVTGGTGNQKVGAARLLNP